MEEPGPPPAQLRLRTGLDGLQVQVSGYAADPWVWLSEGGSWVALLVLVAVAGFAAACTGMWVAFIVFLGLLAVTVVSYSRMDASRTPRHTTLLSRADGLHWSDDGGAEGHLDWRGLRTAEVHGGESPVLVLQRFREEPVAIPMELEPASHAVWVARRLEADRLMWLQKRGTAADVPTALRNIARIPE
jgi:hypothetical protein